MITEKKIVIYVYSPYFIFFFCFLSCACYFVLSPYGHRCEGIHDPRTASKKTKTSNQKPKDIFGTVQYNVGKPAHLTIRRSRPTDTKGRGALDFFTKKKPPRSNPSARTVTFADKNSQDPEVTTQANSKGERRGETLEEKTTVAPENGRICA